MQERRIHQIFVGSMLLKGVFALIEIASGIALSLISTQTITRVLLRFSDGALAANPKDWVATHLAAFAESFSVAAHDFYAFYLISHGVIKAVLIIGLLRRKLWAYPASFAVFGAFIVYQLYRFSFTHDPVLILLSIFDAFIISLAIHEYRLLRHHLPVV